MNLREQQDILRAVADADHPSGSALATIVRTSGSTYRRAGARLLVGPDGPLLGNLSGGCLEDEISEVARRVAVNERAEVVTYDLSAEDEAIWGWGLGCNGAMEVLIEPASAARSLARAVSDALESGRAVTIVTVISSSDEIEPGTRLLLRTDGAIEVSSGSGAFDASVSERLEGSAPSDGILEFKGLRVSIERLAPQPRVLVLGAGHDAIPLVSTCSALGFDVVVVDHREALLNSDRFPGADEFVAADAIEAYLEQESDAFLAAVVMTHNYLKDLEYLATLLPIVPNYLGMLGPRARLTRLLADLAGRGIEPPDELDLRGPAGLDLGAEGPEEIAVAVAAEILAVYHQRGGGPLKERPGSIHGDD